MIAIAFMFDKTEIQLFCGAKETETREGKDGGTEAGKFGVNPKQV